jgi:LysM repeat protein
MVAYVLDPTSGRDGFFYWHNGVIGLRPSYGLVCTVTKTRLRDRLVSTPNAVRAGAIAMVLGGVLYLGFARPVNKSPEKKEPVVAVSTPVQATATTVQDKTSADKTYTIGPADNFWKICNRHYGDGELAKALARYNGIRDLQGLQVGQQIKLPPKEKLKKAAGE